MLRSDFWSDYLSYYTKNFPAVNRCQLFKPTFCFLRRPGRQDQSVIGFQVEDGRRPATRFQEVEVGQQGIDGVPGASL